MNTKIALLVVSMDGIGEATAMGRGARVALVGRNPIKGERTAAKVRAECHKQPEINLLGATGGELL